VLLSAGAAAQIGKALVAVAEYLGPGMDTDLGAQPGLSERLRNLCGLLCGAYRLLDPAA
jgi:hypothetical protein